MIITVWWDGCRISILEACPDTVLPSHLPTVSAHTLQLWEPTELCSQVSIFFLQRSEAKHSRNIFVFFKTWMETSLCDRENNGIFFYNFALRGAVTHSAWTLHFFQVNSQANTSLLLVLLQKLRPPISIFYYYGNNTNNWPKEKHSNHVLCGSGCLFLIKKQTL